jgi:hypothetical protein
MKLTDFSDSTVSPVEECFEDIRTASDAILAHALLIEEVQTELLHRNTPSLVRFWMTNRRSWVEVVTVEWGSAQPIPELDAGEEGYRTSCRR